MTRGEPLRHTGEPRLASVASWAVLAASFGLSASTWIALAIVAGFTGRATVFGATLRLAWLLPVAVDGYVVVALVLWMAPVPARVAAFARKNTYGAAGIGIIAQSAYHLLFTLSTTDEWWRVVLAAIVGALPPAVAGLAVHMRALIRRESSTAAAPVIVSVPTPMTTTAQPTSQPSEQPSNVDSNGVPSIIAGPAITSNPAPSLADSEPTGPTGPAATPEPGPAKAITSEVPTPAHLAARITPPRPTPAASPAVARPAARTTRRPAPTSPSTPAPTLAPSTDTPVTASDAAQLTLPVVASDLLARAAKVARQYRTEHGAPITRASWPSG